MAQHDQMACHRDNQSLKRHSAAQELQDAAGPQEEGRVPRTIEVELTGGLVDAAAAGDAVTVLGWVKVLATDPVAAGSHGASRCH